MKIKLPAKIEVHDYHEFRELQDQIRKIIPGFKIKEIVNEYYGYVGIGYVGPLKNKVNKAFLKQLKYQLRDTAKEYSGGEPIDPYYTP